MKENIIEKLLLSIAKASSESTSWMGLYEPKVPEKLMKQKRINKK